MSNYIIQITNHQATNISSNIVLYISVFFLLLYFHYNISQSLYLSYLFQIFSPRLYTHKHTHTLYLYTISLHSRCFKYVHRPPKSILTLFLSISLFLCTPIHHYVPQLLLHYVILIRIIGINMVSFNSHYCFGHSLRLLLY